MAAVVAAWMAVALTFTGVVGGNEHLWGDFVSWYYSSHEYAAASLKRGTLPLWNPYTDGGLPFLAEADHGTLYPPSWLLLLLPPAALFRGLEMLVLLHLCWATTTAYLLARRLGCQPGPALISGLAFGLGGALVPRAAHVSLACAYAWLPVVVGGALETLLRPGRVPWLAGTIALGLIGLSGHPSAIVIALVAMAVAGAAAVPEVIRRNGVRNAAYGVVRLATLTAIGTLLAAAQLVPMAEFVRLTTRATMAYADLASYAHTPSSLVMLLCPRILGSFRYDVDAYWGPDNFVELSGYTGLVALVLAPLAFRRGCRTAPWLALAIVGLWLALGPHGGLHWIVYRVVPVIGMMRAPARYLVLWNLGIAILAGLGAQGLWDATARDALRRRVTVVALLLGGTVLAGAIVGRGYAAALTLDQRSWMIDGLVRGALSLGAAIAALAVTRFRSRTAERSATVLAALTFLELVAQGRGLGVLPLSRNELAAAIAPITSRYPLLAEPGLFRVRNHFSGHHRLLVGRVQSDSGPGRRLATYEHFQRRIPSRYSSMMQLTNVRYLLGFSESDDPAQTVNLVTLRHAGVANGDEVTFPVTPPIAAHELVLVSWLDRGEASVGDVVAEVWLHSIGGVIHRAPLRAGVDTDFGSGERLSPATLRVNVREWVYVGFSGERYFLSRAAFPAMKVARVTVRHSGGASAFFVKQLFLTRSPGEIDPWERVIAAASNAEPLLSVYRSRTVLPRAFVVRRARFVPTAQEAVALAEAPGFDATTTVLLEGEGARENWGASDSPPPAAVRVDAYEPERVVLAVDGESSGAWLVLTDPHYPGWTATVDGVTTDIRRAYGVFRAVRVPPGRSVVAFEYRPQSVVRGMLLSAAAFLVLAAVALRPSPRRNG